MNRPTTHRHARGLACWLALLAACSPAEHGHEHAPAATEAEAAASSSHIALPADVRKNLGIRFATVELRQVGSSLRLPGSFELLPLARTDYSMALPGRIELRVDELDEVVEGELLFRFQSPAWPELLHEIIQGEQEIVTAGAQIQVSQAKIAENEQRLGTLRTRIRTLAEAEVQSADLQGNLADLEASVPRLEAELQLAQTLLANAKRTREHALHRAASASGITEQDLDKMIQVPGETEPVHNYETIDWIEVRARRSGLVDRLGVVDGAYVDAQTSVLMTLDPTQVRLRATALQGDLDLQDVPDRASILALEHGERSHPAVPAELAFALAADPHQRTIGVLAKPGQWAPWMRPGVAAFLEIPTDPDSPMVLAVPQGAVLRDGLQHVLFRRNPNDPNEVLRVLADLGPSDGRWTGLQSGVMQGDEVVLDGAYELKLATEQSGGSSKGGHFHADGTFHEEH